MANLPSKGQGEGGASGRGVCILAHGLVEGVAVDGEPGHGGVKEGKQAGSVQGVGGGCDLRGADGEQGRKVTVTNTSPPSRATAGRGDILGRLAARGVAGMACVVISVSPFPWFGCQWAGAFIPRPLCYMGCLGPEGFA